MQTLMSIVGMFVLLAIAYLLSTDRKAINRRTVMTALAVQTAIAGLIDRTCVYRSQGNQSPV